MVATLSDRVSEEREAWAPRERLTVSQWAATRRRLTLKESPEPGKWRNDRTPYLVEIMDTLGDASVDIVVIKKPAQIGASEAVRNFIGWAVEQDPGPALWVLPDQQATEEAVQERLQPMIRSSLKGYMSDRAYDIKNSKLALASMDIYMAWAGSPSRLATRPVRYVIFDEVNKYALWSGRDADPIALGGARTRTWGRRKKIVILSTPTLRSGQVSQAFRQCEDQREFQIPCTCCGAYFAPRWSCVKWPPARDGETDKEHAARVRAESLARLECPEPACKHRMTEAERLDACQAGIGRWVSKFNIAHRKPRSVGFELSVLATPWTPMSELAAKFITITEPQKLMEFINQDLGEDWVERVDVVDAEHLIAKSEAGHPRLIVPSWAGCIVGGVDTQKGYFCWVLRAFGAEFRSRLIDHGQAQTFDQLAALLLHRSFLIEGCTEAMPKMPVSMVAIDSGGGKAAATSIDGSRTDEVYRWSLTDPRILPIKGHGGKAPPTAPIRHANPNYTPPDKTSAYKVQLKILHTEHFKDLLSNRIKHEDESLWEVHGEIDDDYMSQMVSEHKVFDRRRGSMHWQPKTKSAANHYWDAETYAAAAAVMVGAGAIPPEHDLQEQRQRTWKGMQQAQDLTAERSVARRREDEGGWVQGQGWWDR